MHQDLNINFQEKENFDFENCPFDQIIKADEKKEKNISNSNNILTPFVKNFIFNFIFMFRIIIFKVSIFYNKQ